jgi:nitrogen fixation protein FixH
MTPVDDPEEKPAEAAAPEAAPVPEAEKPKPKQPLPAWMALAGIVAFVAVALGVGYLIWLLAKTFELGKHDNSYGMYGVGRVVAKNVYEDVQGWGSELLIDKKPDVPARIRFLLRDATKQPITDAEVSIVMNNIDDAGIPATKADLKMVEPGVYRGDVNIPKPGAWEARIQVKQKGNAYQITHRVTVPESEKEKAEREKADKEAKGKK